MWTRVEVAVWLFIYICSTLNERCKLDFVFLYSMLSDLSTFRSCFLKGIKIWVGPLCRLHTLSCHSMSGRNDILFQKACIRWIMLFSGIYGYGSTDRCKLFLPQYLISFAFTLKFFWFRWWTHWGAGDKKKRGFAMIKLTPENTLGHLCWRR